MPSRVCLLVAGLIWSSISFADEPDPPADSTAPAAATADSDAPAPKHKRPVRVHKLDVDEPAVEPPDDDIWTWIARMEGEVPDPSTVEAVEERAEEHLAESALIDELGGVDVPVEFYRDPAAALTPDPLHLDQVDPKEFDIPVTVNDAVAKWVTYFTGAGRKYYKRYLERSTTYQPMMLRQLEAAGLPHDLVYLSMIESGYNAHAYSSAHAVGLWQFIPSTGRLYDLRVDWWVDERRDPEKSTKAAIAFLGELHEMFGDWYLAWAAYNGGPGRVRKAVSHAGTTDFWTLADGAWLHDETDNYVPKIIAAAIIGKHPERYGFTDIAYQDELTYDTAVVSGSVDVAVLAECAGMTEDDFRWLNPALRRWATPEGDTDIRLPSGRKDAFVAALDAIPAAKRVAFAQHTVTRGETLSLIARRYSVSVDDLVRVNGLKNADRIFVGMNLVIPTSSGSAETLVASRGTTTATDAPAPAPSRPSSYTVVRGDTLSGIAARYSLDLDDLRRWNGISGSTIVPGQKLTLRSSSSGGSSSGSSAGGSSSSSGTTSTYVVAKGDTLSGIASKFGISLGTLQRDNGIRNASEIYVGQKLKIHTTAESWHTLTVKAGDTLSALASRAGCSVSDLQSWNGISGSTIHPGQTLKYR